MATVLPMVLMAVGTTVSAIGTIQQGKEAKRQANFQAQQADLQSKEEMIAANIAATNARQAEADTTANWAETMRQKERVLGQQRSAASKSGLILSGSVLYGAEDTAVQFQREAGRAFTSGMNTAGNYRGEAGARQRSALNMTRTAANYRASGRAALRSSYLSAAGQMFSGFGQASSMLASRPKPK